jgi:FKBP-type peptidyl-prolyl cis-trans isomerase
MMQEGARWELYVPARLGYTRLPGTRYTRKPGPLTDQLLIFELELRQVSESRPATFASLSRAATPRPSAGLPHVFVYLMADDEPDPETAARGGGPETRLAITTETLRRPARVPAERQPPQDGEAAETQAREPAQQPAETPDTAQQGQDAPAAMPPIVLESGLGYRVLRSGRGLPPVPGDLITIEYRENLADPGDAEAVWHREGQVTLPVTAASPAWALLLQRMEEGARWTLRAPPALAREVWGPPGDGAAVTLDLELMNVTAAPPRGMAVAALGSTWEPEDPGGHATVAPASTAAPTAPPGGIRYRVLRKPTGGGPAADDIIRVSHRSTLLSDTGGEAYVYHAEGESRFRLRSADGLWQEIFRRMGEGARWELYLPSELMRGKWGPPGGQTVVVVVELSEVES